MYMIIAYAWISVMIALLEVKLKDVKNVLRNNSTLFKHAVKHDPCGLCGLTKEIWKCA